MSLCPCLRYWLLFSRIENIKKLERGSKETCKAKASPCTVPRSCVFACGDPSWHFNWGEQTPGFLWVWGIHTIHSFPVGVTYTFPRGNKATESEVSRERFCSSSTTCTPFPITPHYFDTSKLDGVTEQAGHLERGHHLSTHSPWAGFPFRDQTPPTTNMPQLCSEMRLSEHLYSNTFLTFNSLINI